MLQYMWMRNNREGTTSVFLNRQLARLQSPSVEFDKARINAGNTKSKSGDLNGNPIAKRPRTWSLQVEIESDYFPRSVQIKFNGENFGENVCA